MGIPATLGPVIAVLISTSKRFHRPQLDLAFSGFLPKAADDCPELDIATWLR